MNRALARGSMIRPATQRGRPALGVGVLTALLVTLGEGRAEAFRCTRVSPEAGPSLVWRVRSISWWLDSAVADIGDDGRAESTAAFEAWQSPACSDMVFPLEGVRSGLVSEYLASGGNRNVVVLLDEWSSAPGTIALTVSAYDTRTGTLLDADIELNGEKFVFGIVEPASCAAREAGSMDLRNTLTHEVGHVIGLDHPPASPRFAEATMFASAPPCETAKRTLAADDVEGLCAIYPAGSDTAPCFPPDQPGFRVVDESDGYGCRAAGRGRDGGLAALLFAALGGIALRATRRRGPRARSS